MHLQAVNEQYFGKGKHGDGAAGAAEGDYHSEDDIEMVHKLGYDIDRTRTRTRATYVPSADAVRNGLRPGDVGYDGYDLHLFEGVFPEEDAKGKR